MNPNRLWDLIHLLLAGAAGIAGAVQLSSGNLRPETFLLLTLAWTAFLSFYFRERAAPDASARSLKIVFLGIVLLPLLAAGSLVRSKYESDAGRGGADIYVHGGSDVRGGVDHFKALLKEQPLSAVIWYQLGEAYRRERLDDEAIASYGNAIALRGDFSEAYTRRGTIYVEKKGEVRKGMDDFDFAIRYSPRNAEAHYHRGNAFILTDDPDRAIQDYTKAIGLKPDYAEAYASRSLAYLTLGNRDAALSDHQKALTLATDPSLREEIMKGLHDAMTM